MLIGIKDQMHACTVMCKSSDIFSLCNNNISNFQAGSMEDEDNSIHENSGYTCTIAIKQSIQFNVDF